jgi:uncharacterized protein YegL
VSDPDPPLLVDVQHQRRLLVFILADRSISMQGAPIVALNQGIQFIRDDLLDDPRAFETAWLSLISYGGEAVVDVAPTPIESFSPPLLVAGGSTPLGSALELMLGQIAANHRDADYVPVAFVLTDGVPNDSAWDAASVKVRDAVAANRLLFTGIAVGDSADEQALLFLANDDSQRVRRLPEMNDGAIRAIAQFVSRSVKVASYSSGRPDGASSVQSPAVL